MYIATIKKKKSLELCINCKTRDIKKVHERKIKPWRQRHTVNYEGKKKKKKTEDEKK